MLNEAERYDIIGGRAHNKKSRPDEPTVGMYRTTLFQYARNQEFFPINQVSVAVLVPVTAVMAMIMVMVIMIFIVTMLVVAMLAMPSAAAAFPMTMMMMVFMSVMTTAMIMSGLLRIEGTFDGIERAALSPDQFFEFRIDPDEKRIGGSLNRNMLVTELPGQTHETQRIFRRHLEKLLGRRPDGDQLAVLKPESIPILQIRSFFG